MKTPQFGVDYDVGCIGFTYVNGWVSSVVGYFERWHGAGGPRVTHALVVTGDNECVEAHFEEGVARVALTKYFADPNCRIYFRRPRGWNPALGGRIAASAAARVGGKYATGLIVAAALADSLAGRWLNRLLRSWPNRIASRLLDFRGSWICSELAARALADQPELRGRGILGTPLDTIDPQTLFADTVIFEVAEIPAAEAKT